MSDEPEASPPADPPGPDTEPRNPWRDEWRDQWRNERRREWRHEWRAEGLWGAGGRDHRPPFVRYAGCFIVFVVVAASLVLVLVAWLISAVMSFLIPGMDVIWPPVALIAAVAVVLVILLIAGSRVFGSAVNPLTEIAEATDRLADGEPGVRVRPRGPRPVRRLAGSFNTMAERLDRSRDDRRSMLADVTHELRTPLTVVQGGLEAMVDGVHPMDEDHVAPLLAETAVMTRLLDDLRTLSLADAGALTLHREPADIAALAREVVAANASLAAAKRLTLEATGDDRLVTEIDPVRVREVIANLVSNALRHTPSGGRVEVEVRADAEAAIVTVRDTGEGIPPADLARVFDRYQRRSDTGGTGLGLAIVRDLVAAHGGTVTAASDGVPGHGSTFRVWIPRRD